ncbi:unnamed protein product [Blepharisma stoltei]|uniref:Uncharacterized protein n=1 Tax=Blepharisma stoltei TaxID=1481888 RepID=A0AAU9K5R3_9CILI|nr:unnamed protein product [Blepharisma stoltei]
MDSESETVISENELPRLLSTYLDISIDFIKHLDYEKALDALSHNEDLLNAAAMQKAYVDPDFIVATSHNSALCYQKLGLLQECASALMTSISVCTSFLDVNYPHQYSLQTTDEKLMKLNYSCKIHLQLCAILSQLEQHDEALINAKKALTKIQEVININLKLCKEHLERHKKLIETSSLRKRVQKQPQYKLFESPHYLRYHQLVTKALPILKILDSDDFNQINRHKINCEGCEWIYEYNIGDIMTIQVLFMDDLKWQGSSQTELSTEILLEKAFIIAAAQFCIAVEMRFLVNKGSVDYFLLESKVWMQRAIKIAWALLPDSSPLLSYMKSLYNKNYKEESPRKSHLKLLLKESRSNSFVRRPPSRAKTPNSIGNNGINRSNSFSLSKTPSKTPKHDKESKLLNKSEEKIRRLEPLKLREAKNLEKNTKIEEKSPNSNKKISYPVPYQQLHSKLEKIQVASYDESDFSSDILPHSSGESENNAKF